MVIFQDNPLEFLSYFLLKKCSKKNKHFEGNVILTKSDPKTTHSLLTKVKLLWHLYAVASLYSLRNVLKKLIISNDNSNLKAFNLSFLVRTSFSWIFIFKRVFYSFIMLITLNLLD